jgi:hypothetical protein
MRFDGLSLLDNQHCHQTVRDHEQYGQQWQPANFLAGSFSNFGDFFVFDRSEQRRQGAPRSFASSMQALSELHPGRQFTKTSQVFDTEVLGGYTPRRQ